MFKGCPEFADWAPPSRTLCLSLKFEFRPKTDLLEGSWTFPAQDRVPYFSMEFARHQVRGIDLDAQTRCVHYKTELDIVAIKMRCCGVYYACKECHKALADHALEVWPQSEWDRPAVLCGACHYEMAIREYMTSGYRCPHCQAQFNPGCRNHHQFYFATAA
jgi:uncharacterized CHY-type Zn-finger protein